MATFFSDMGPTLRTGLLLSTLAFVGAADSGEIPTQADVNSFVTRVSGLDLGNTAYAATGKTFEDGHCRWTFDSGVFVPIEAGEEDRRVVGVAFVGEGTMEVRFPRRGAAWNFANHMVVNGDSSIDDMAPVASQDEPYRVSITEGIILSADDKVVRLLTGLEPLGAGTVYTETDEGEYDLELMVTDRKGRLRAVANAYDMMAPRMTLLRKAGWDGELMVGRDRLLHEGLGVPSEELGLVGDFLTRDRFGVALESSTPLGSRKDDQWLTCLRDGSGSYELGRQQSVFAHGIDQREVYMRDEFGGQPIPDADQSLPVRAIHADSVVEVSPSVDRITLQAEVQQRLSFYAERDVRHLTLRFPREESLDGDFELLDIRTPDGMEVARVEFTRLAADLPDWAFDDGIADRTDIKNSDNTTPGGVQEQDADVAELDVSGQPRNGGPRDLGHTVGTLELVIALPQTVPAGEFFELDFSWRAKWPYDVTYMLQVPGGASPGISSGFRSVVPRVVPSTARAAWSYEPDVGVPRGRRQPVAAVSGDTVKTWSDEGRDWTRTQGVGALRPGVVAGRYRTTEQGKVKLHVLGSDLWALEEYPAEIERAADFIETLLGPLPNQELEVYQGPIATAAGGRIPGQGLLEVLNPWTTPSAEEIARNPRKPPRPEQITPARQLAMQYFANWALPLGVRNRWLGVALPDAYGSFYIREVYGDDWYYQGVDGMRYMLENSDGLGIPSYQRWNKSMTLYSTRQDLFSGAWRMSGVYIVTGMLPRETGWAGLLTGLREYQQSHISQDITTDQLQAALEEASDTDLSDFFDYWVTGSLVPDLKTTWTRSEDESVVTVCVQSSLPFGRFEAPVAVMDQNKARVEELVITVENGAGVASMSDREGKMRVVMDPGGFLLTRSRKTRKVDDLPEACQAAAPIEPAPESPSPAP